MHAQVDESQSSILSCTTNWVASSKKEQRMFNVLLPETKSAILRHTDTSEVIVCIYGSAIECFYDEQGNGDRNGSDESRKRYFWFMDRARKVSFIEING